MPRGSQPGERRGGRQKGTPNKVTAKIRAEMRESGLSMQEIMVGSARALWNAAHDGKTIDLDMAERAGEMAAKVAPYFHRRLASVAHTGPDGGPVVFEQLRSLTDEQLAAIEPVLAALAAAGAPPGASTH